MTIIIFVHPFAGISDPPLYFYRDKDMNEIDLLIENNGTLYPIEIKKHADPQKSDAKAFKLIDSIPNVKKGQGGIVCLYDNLVTMTEGVKVIPIKYLWFLADAIILIASAFILF